MASTSDQPPSSATSPAELAENLREVRNRLRNPTRVPVYIGNGLLHLPTRNGYSLIGFSDDLQITASLITHQLWEPTLTSFLRKRVRLDMQVIEIGANIGYFSVLLSNLVGFRGRVDVFEPNPRTLEVLRRNVRMNNISHVCHIHPVALAQREGTITLNAFTLNQGGSTLSQLPEQLLAEWHEKPTSVEVRTARLDDLFAHDQRKIDVIKIDAEGSEFWIWQGADRFFRQNTHEHTIIAMEFNPPALSGTGCDPRALLDLVRSHGFRFWALQPDDRYTEITDTSTISLSVNTDLLLCRRPL